MLHCVVPSCSAACIALQICNVHVQSSALPHANQQKHISFCVYLHESVCANCEHMHGYRSWRQRCEHSLAVDARERQVHLHQQDAILQLWSMPSCKCGLGFASKNCLSSKLLPMYAYDAVRCSTTVHGDIT